MEKRQVVVNLFVPANQDTAKAIHPAVGAFYDPPSRFETCLPFEPLRFFPARAEVSREAKLPQRSPHLRIVVTLVQTHPLRPFLGRAWPLDHEALYGLLHQFHIMPIGPRDG